MSDHDGCFICGCIPLADALPVTMSTIKEDGRRRLPRVETLVAEMGDDARAGIFEWVSSVLRRPPFEHAGVVGPWGNIVSFLECLRWDISERTFDTATTVIPLPHPRVIAAEMGTVTVIGDGKYIVDGNGMTE